MRQALLIVDVQPCFAPPDWLLEGIGQLLGRMPSVASVERHDESRTPFQRQLGWRPPLDDACLVAADRVFVKHGYLPTAELVDHLRALRAERVLVCGIQADTCVLAAGFALFDAGLQPTLVGDLVLGSSLDRSGELGVRLWKHHFGQVVSLARCWRIEAQWGRLSSATVASAFIIRAAASGVSPALDVGAAGEEQFDHRQVALERSAGQRCLPGQVAQVRVGLVGQQQAYRVGVAMVAGQHQQAIALVVAQVRRQALLQQLLEALAVALAGQVEQLVDELLGFHIQFWARAIGHGAASL
ncbi:hydrolase [Pseudomonas aeruginosa VRFPA09]|nr:hydrolase [Pseudomonas aeruginosa VRFPA09]